ncbi:MAG: hypothetical protein B6245_03240 [Desulfobacteraceae bacterium 4572_88]|nr:MAG: hypothetical protein B6245_03240 [Desulfobacteraceae bacterium 4572_88]
MSLQGHAAGSAPTFPAGRGFNHRMAALISGADMSEFLICLAAIHPRKHALVPRQEVWEAVHITLRMRT